MTHPLDHWAYDPNDSIPRSVSSPTSETITVAEAVTDGNKIYITYSNGLREVLVPDNIPTQTHGDGKPKRSRSKGQQVIEAVSTIHTLCANVEQGNEVNVAAVAEIIRLADKLRELIRIPR